MFRFLNCLGFVFVGLFLSFCFLFIEVPFTFVVKLIGGANFS